ncbi:MAG: acylphosphatase [Nitrososphaeria archaeon]|nr:acylphosphatase [Nitrososphaeria archaeon]
MRRVVVVAKGEVQRVGYRDEVERIARKLNITGYVENLKPYDVKIVAEGDEEKLKHFIELIKIQRFPIFVESLEVSWHNASGEFNYFEIKRGEWQEELFERLDTAGKLLYKSIELGERSIELGEKNVKLGERSVKLAEKNVELAEKSFKLGEENVRIGKGILKTIKDESEKTREEIRLLRSDLKEFIESSLKEVHIKISEIEKALKKAGIM